MHVCVCACVCVCTLSARVFLPLLVYIQSAMKEAISRNAVESPELPPFQLTMVTPPLNETHTLIIGGATNMECDPVKHLFGAEDLTDEFGSEIMYAILACIATMVIVGSSEYQRVTCNAAAETPGAVSKALTYISMVAEASEDSGCEEGVSVTRGDNSGSESDSSDTSEPAHAHSIPVNVEPSDYNQNPSKSREESNHGMCGLQMATPTQCQQSTNNPLENPPVAGESKKGGTGKSATMWQNGLASNEVPRVLLVGPNDVPSQPPHSGGALEEETGEGGDHTIAASVPSSHSTSDGTWGEETDDENRAPNVASTEPSELISGSEGSWAEETHEGHHNLTLPFESDQGQSELTGIFTTNVGEPPPVIPTLHNEHNVDVVVVGPGTFDGGGAGMPFILQMFNMEPQPPPQPEMWHHPVQESEEGRKKPSQLVHGHITS